MTLHQSTKSEIMRRNPVIRVMNILGMLVWKEKLASPAEFNIRRYHPVTWLWVAYIFVIGVFIQGYPETIADLKSSIREDLI